ncbi:hypothetical protein [Phascolarctobacterium sp.]
MSTNNLNTGGRFKLELLQDCAGTLRSVDALKSRLDYSAASTSKKRQALQAARRQNLQGPTAAATFFNYQKALATAERQAAALYRALQKNTGDKKETLLASLRQTVNSYQKLHQEAEDLQAAFGTTQAAGSVDFNDIDYFIAKLRCGAAAAGQQELFKLLFDALTAKMQALSELDIGSSKQMQPAASSDNGAMYLLAADFLAVMSAYEKDLQETFTVADKWRQLYQDEEIVKTLVRATLKLANIGAMQPTAAADALSSVLRQYAVELSSVYEAELAADEIIDSWGKMSVEYGFTMVQLAQANDEAAGAAYRAGVDFSYLQALVAGLLHSSKLNGAAAGRYLRGVLLWLGTPAAVKQLQELGVDCYSYDGQGKKQVRCLQDVILEAVQHQQHHSQNIEVVLADCANGHFRADALGVLFGAAAELQQKLQTVSSAKGWSKAQYKQNGHKKALALLELQQQADSLLQKLQAGNTESEQALTLVLTELSNGLKNLQPDFMTAFQGSAELLLLFQTILTLAEAARAGEQQGISAILGLRAAQTGKARGSVWRYQ